MKYSTEHSMTTGPLKQRMEEFLLSAFAMPLSKRYPGPFKTLREQITAACDWEFGPKAEVTFPDLRTVVLRCGTTEMRIAP